MEMVKAEDFALGDTSQEFCRYCTDKHGKLLSWEEILQGNVQYYMESQGLTSEAALRMATDYLKTLPAWKNR
jgi:hypothetical protein